MGYQQMFFSGNVETNFVNMAVTYYAAAMYLGM